MALALSPHLDDAAFSCGGTLAKLARTGWRVVVATLFTRSVADPKGFALACQLDKGLGPEVDYMALRREEDAAAMRALGAEAEWLPFAEAPHRRYGSAAELFGAVRADDGIVPALAAEIQALAGRLAPALVLAPQAIGGHVDHVQAVRAIDMAGLGVPTAWWRDFPYSARVRRPLIPNAFVSSPAPHAEALGKAEPRSTLNRSASFEAELRSAPQDEEAEKFSEPSTRFADLPEREVALDPPDLASRRAACLAYASQLGFQFGGPDGLDEMLARAGAVERFRGAPLPC